MNILMQTLVERTVKIMDGVTKRELPDNTPFVVFIEDGVKKHYTAAEFYFAAKCGKFK